MPNSWSRSEWKLAPCGTRAAYRRHFRRGEKPCAACVQANSIASGTTVSVAADTRELRNGIPWQPYRYRGSGADAYTGEIVQ